MAQKKKFNLPTIIPTRACNNKLIKKKNNNQLINRNTSYSPTYSQPQLVQPTQIFRGNLAKNMRFGNPGDTLSGYVQREVIMIDKQGNKQIARERQFFNSGRHIDVEIGKK